MDHSGFSKALLKSLKAYLDRYPQEEGIVMQFKTLLSEPECFSKENYPAHFTGSAWIVDPAESKVLLLHHAKLAKWLQPGGHLEEGEFPWDAALREAYEEVGLKVELEGREKGFVIPLDLDCHSIPARGEMKEHFHYDFRFLAFASFKEALGGQEGLKMKWFDLEEVYGSGYELSLQRMAEKSPFFTLYRG